ncbi:hypothetical protein F5Y08DRAFT_64571 [Xylaria arbuscula]|nr:hypothetical protein F5Y08DRAFT_64571 [Xylaria arbuscula]
MDALGYWLVVNGCTFACLLALSVCPSVSLPLSVVLRTAQYPSSRGPCINLPHSRCVQATPSQSLSPMTLSFSSTVLLVRLISSSSVLAAITQFSVRVLLLPYIKYVQSLLYPDPCRAIPKECAFHGSSTGAVPGIPSVSNCILPSNGRRDPSGAHPDSPRWMCPLRYYLALLTCSEAGGEHIINGQM